MEGPHPRCPREDRECTRACRYATLRGPCALDIAEAVQLGARQPTLSEIGAWEGLTRERIRQIEVKALDKLRRRLLRVEAGLPAHLRAPDEGATWRCKEHVSRRIVRWVRSHPGSTSIEVACGVGAGEWAARDRLGHLRRRGVVRHDVGAGNGRPLRRWWVT